MIKHALVTIAAACMLSAADAQLRTPQPSPAQMVRQDFGLSTVELNYSRPAMKGRKIFGDLVPFGKVWRTGANSATRIKFGEDVNFGGQALPAGEYALFTVPGKNEWEIIINKGNKNWGSEYVQSLDVLRVKATPMKMKKRAESFTIEFANVKGTSMELHILWDRTAVAIPVTVDIDTKVMAQIERLSKVDSLPYFNAAMYYMDNGKDMNQALGWLDKAAEKNPNAFWIQHQRANALAKLGRKEEAVAAAQKSMEMAREQKNEDYVRLNEKLIKSLK